VQTYEQVLKANNFFLTTVATIPINLEYEAWFAVIDPYHQSEQEPLSLYDHLTRQPWFLRIESVNKHKCLLVTNKTNLPEARAWIDVNLEWLIRKSIPPETNPLPSLLPRRLDKPVYSPTSQTYADILKKQFSLNSTPTTAESNNQRPSCKRQAKILDYAMDQASGPVDATNFTSASTGSSPPLATSKTAPVDYAAELLSLRAEPQSLCTLISTTVTELKTDIQEAIESLNTPPSKLTSNTETKTPTLSNMETEDEPPTTTTPELSDLIADLKHDIATKLDISDLVSDLKLDIALIKSHPLFCNLKPINKQVPAT